MSFNINKTPFFTVIVPVYNTNESYLIEAIESVINQTFKDYELIIVDDASTVDYKIKKKKIKPLGIYPQKEALLIKIFYLTKF